MRQQPHDERDDRQHDQHNEQDVAHDGQLPADAEAMRIAEIFADAAWELR